jgi:hypothetical protein
MDRSPLEAAIVFLVFVASFIVAHLLRLPKRKWRVSDTRLPTKSHRMPFHYSLRTLLITITAVAVVLGVIVWAVR